MKLLPLAIAALNGKARSELAGLTGKVRILAISGVFAVLAAVFLLGAVTLLLAQEIGAIYACLVMSALFACGAFISLLIHKRAQRKRQLERVENIALASSAGKTVSADSLALAQAFARGFMNGK